MSIIRTRSQAASEAASAYENEEYLMEDTFQDEDTEQEVNSSNVENSYAESEAASQETNETGSQNNESPSHLFTFPMKICWKNFYNERNMTEIIKETLFHCNTVNQFQELLFPTIKTYIKKEIIENNGVYSFNEDEIDIDSIGKFVVFTDKKNKKSFSWEAICNRRLNKLYNWTKDYNKQMEKKKEISVVLCVVLVYGTILQTKAQFTEVEKQLLKPAETDRANAPLTEAVFAMVRTLKERHGDTLSAQDPIWMRWANLILSAEVTLQASLIEVLPPDPILRLMTHGNENPVGQAHAARRSVAVGQSVNEGIQEVYEKLLEDVNVFIAALKELMTTADVIKARVEGLGAQLRRNDRMMQGFDQALGVQMNPMAQEQYDNIQQQQDVDHQ